MCSPGMPETSFRHTDASVRNHGGIPDIDEEVHELEIGGLVNKPVKISLKDLKDPSKFP